MDEKPSFLFITCQVGAEAAVKAELTRDWPGFRFAYSRPGFLTFKLPADHELADDFDLNSVFARAHGFSIGRATGESLDQLAQGVWKLAGDRPFDRLHVWQRDLAPCGYHGYEPSITAEARAAEEAIRRNGPGDSAGASPSPEPARRGQRVLDCILVEPDMWWVGYHRAGSWASRWPGGMRPIELPPEAVSRAYLKMEEALAWSRLPIKPGDPCVEIGCSPGGASQALLNRGLLVTGIDPAAVHPSVLAHPNFVHIQKRGADVRRREFRKTRWLTADMNVAPSYTLDTVEAIVTHREVHVQGLLLTLKLLEWSLAAEVPEYLARVRSWGFTTVRARQLQHNRQEICVAARRSKE
ncbi:MAG: SAM-dependent methyltransferase [Pirellulales bacterium]